jgi:FAD synthase
MSDSVKKYIEKMERDNNLYDEFVNSQWAMNSTIPIQNTSKDLIVQEVKDLYDARSEVGINKYNTTLEDSLDGLETFLEHLQEELMDATLYIQKLKQIIDERK